MPVRPTLPPLPAFVVLDSQGYILPSPYGFHLLESEANKYSNKIPRSVVVPVTVTGRGK